MPDYNTSKISELLTLRPMKISKQPRPLIFIATQRLLTSLKYHGFRKTTIIICRKCMEHTLRSRIAHSSLKHKFWTSLKLTTKLFSLKNYRFIKADFSRFGKDLLRIIHDEKASIIWNKEGLSIQRINASTRISINLKYNWIASAVLALSSPKENTEEVDLLFAIINSSNLSQERITFLKLLLELDPSHRLSLSLLSRITLGRSSFLYWTSHINKDVENMATIRIDKNISWSQFQTKITLSGNVILSPHSTQSYSLAVSVQGIEKPITWGLPSPKIAEKVPLAPNKCHSRFRRAELKVNIGAKGKILIKTNGVEKNVLWEGGPEFYPYLRDSKKRQNKYTPDSPKPDIFARQDLPQVIKDLSPPFENQDFALIISEVQKLHIIHPRNFEISTLLAICLDRTGQTSESEAIAKDLIINSDDFLFTYHYDWTMDLLEFAANQLNPLHIRLRLACAMHYGDSSIILDWLDYIVSESDFSCTSIKDKDFRQILTVFDDSVLSDQFKLFIFKPKIQQIFERLALNYSKYSNWNRVISIWEFLSSFAVLDTDYIYALQNKYSAMIKAGDLEVAIENIEKAIENYPNNWGLINQYIHWAKKTKNHTDAISMLKKYADNYGHNKESYASLAELLHLEGRFKEAATVVKEGMGQSYSIIDISKKRVFTEQEYLDRWGYFEKPTITILCTAYNHGRYIEESIKGYLMQDTDYPFEVIIHDDASTDNSQQIIKEWAQKYPRIIRTVLQTENKYSQGIKPFSIIRRLALGDFVARCEGDDYWLREDKLQKQVKFLIDNPDFSCCFHNFYYFREDRLSVYPLTTNHQDISLSEDSMKKVQLLARLHTLVYRNCLPEHPEEAKYMAIGDGFLTSFLGTIGKGMYFGSYLGAVGRRNRFSSYYPLDERIKSSKRLQTNYWIAQYYLRRNEPHIATHFLKRALRNLYFRAPSSTLEELSKNLDLKVIEVERKNRKVEKERKRITRRKIIAKKLDLVD